jgi:hypothetical protein
MEARWCVEFTGVELVGGAKLAALVEKVATGRSGGEDGPLLAATVGRRRHGEGER